MADDVKLCVSVSSKPPPPLNTVDRRQHSPAPSHCYHLSKIQQGNSEFKQPFTTADLSSRQFTSPLNISITDSDNCGSISPTGTNNIGDTQVLDPDKIMKRVLYSIFRELKSCSLSNLEYFRNGKQSYHARLQVAFSLLCEHINKGIEPQLGILLPHLASYDISPEIPANGYRSLLMIIQKCCLHLLQLSRYIMINRNCVLFRIVHYTRELESYVTVLGQLRACLYFSCQLMNYCPKDSLFIDKDVLKDPVAFRLLKEFDSLSQDCFYGRCLGFQFCESMRKPLLCVVVALASFSEGYNETTNFMKFAYSVLSTGKYLLDPELRARQVVHVARSADIQFCKSFWSLLETDISSGVTDFVSSCNKSVINVVASAGTKVVDIGSKVMSACMSRMSLLSGFILQVNSVLKIEPVPIELPKTDSKGKETLCIEAPSIYSGLTNLQFRLLSFDLLQGQEKLLKDHLIIRLPSKAQPPSPNLLFHIHGGGFVAQSSKSHEVYLRQWAHDLKVPIVSVDYSLAPENPFPRALEECFYLYAWVLKNPEQVGWTGERICFTGDSAGGNLVLAVTLRAIDSNIRIPDGILAVYTSALISIVPSPSRLLSVMDPLLPVGVMLKCLDAYIGTSTVSSDYCNQPVLEEDCETPSTEKDEDSLDNSRKIKDVSNYDCETSESLSSDLTEFFSPDDSDDDDEDDGGGGGGDDQKTNSHLPKQYLPHESYYIPGADLPLSSASSPGHVPHPDGHLPRSLSTPVFNKTENVLRPPHHSSFDSSNVQSAMERFLKLTLIQNPLVSPIYATDKQLQMFPEVSLVTCHLDPLLDDSVMLCKRLRQLGKTADFTVLDDLPHGFLNFVLVSKDARQGSNVCVEKLRKLFNLI
ncbi:hormone-sensitive lipase isoform X1 [Octopus vulgaris]|uniref:Hormone-sensitive lipase isoform X1 n=2 Tax=Octopus TaxID=6643 RepID=A0AA36AVI3_OCTVU|nr:hormone-sensitive lipase isoform X1 [Octopus sinensis]CAI9723045.1 hormone-sensitive lipase isoform X1 [Octopus vulgaris]